MIPARKWPLFNAWFSRHAEGRIRAHFSAVHVAGLPTLEAHAAAGPVLVVCNHSSWWDALWLLALAHRILRADGYAMMDGANLRARPFFAYVGAFGVDRTRADDGARAVRYAARLLSAPGRLVFVFPQGEERPRAVRPLGFVSGSAAIARLASRAVTLPMALAYEHGPEERPVLLAAIGPPVTPSRDVEEGRARQEAAVLAQLERVERYWLTREGGAEFEPRWVSAPSAWGRAAERALAWLTRGALAGGD